MESIVVIALALCLCTCSSEARHPHTRRLRVYVNVTVDTYASKGAVDAEFLSVSLSPKRITAESLPWTSERLQLLAKGLSPAWLRIGGAESDYLRFAPPPTDDANVSAYKREHSSEVDPVTLRMTPTDWDDVNYFAEQVGWNIIFALNVQFRESGVWNSTNAGFLVEYTAQRGYKMTSWALGNEPLRFGVLPNTTAISPEELARDFYILNTLLSSSTKVSHFVAGPDISKPLTEHHEDPSPAEYLQRFLEAGREFDGVVNAITWHHYYIDGWIAVLNDFLSIPIMDTLLDNISIIQNITADYSVPVWLGETSDAFHGGAPGLSNTYAAGFLLMDKLGIAAALNISVVMKEAFIGGSYGLLDSNLTPLPMYWLSLLHKLLMGSNVLVVQNGLHRGRQARIYAHCTKYHTSAPDSIIPRYSLGAVTLMVINLYQSPVELLLHGSLSDSSKDMYILTPLGCHNNTLLGCDLKSQTVQLNGSELKLISNSTLPQLHPKHQERKQSATLPPLSYGFVVIKDAKATACLNHLN